MPDVSGWNLGADARLKDLSRGPGTRLVGGSVRQMRRALLLIERARSREIVCRPGKAESRLIQPTQVQTDRIPLLGGFSVSCHLGGSHDDSEYSDGTNYLRGRDGPRARRLRPWGGIREQERSGARRIGQAAVRRTGEEFRGGRSHLKHPQKTTGPGVVLLPHLDGVNSSLTLDRAPKAVTLQRLAFVLESPPGVSGHRSTSRSWSCRTCSGEPTSPRPQTSADSQIADEMIVKGILADSETLPDVLVHDPSDLRPSPSFPDRLDRHGHPRSKVRRRFA